MQKSGPRKKWYYDACALDNDKRTYEEIYNGGKRQGRVALAGNLSIGEAYGSSHRKRGPEAADSFLELLRRLIKIKGRGTAMFVVVHHKGIEKIFWDIRDSFPALGIEDSIHLATAIQNGCSELRTADSDLYKLSAKEIKALATKFNNPSFRITKMS